MIDKAHDPEIAPRNIFGSNYLEAHKDDCLCESSPYRDNNPIIDIEFEFSVPDPPALRKDFQLGHPFLFIRMKNIFLSRIGTNEKLLS